MTFGHITALADVMVVLAAVPSVSVLAVTTRSAVYGCSHALLTTAGIVLGDVIFILAAIYGVSALAGAMGGLFVLVKYLGAACLVWLGIALWRCLPFYAGGLAQDPGRWCWPYPA